MTTNYQTPHEATGIQQWPKWAPGRPSRLASICRGGGESAHKQTKQTPHATHVPPAPALARGKAPWPSLWVTVRHRVTVYSCYGAAGVQQLQLQPWGWGRPQPGEGTAWAGARAGP